MKAKIYPDSLHQYKMLYSDNTHRCLYACGMTHAYTMSKEYWPNDQIKEVYQLEDSWKN